MATKAWIKTNDNPDVSNAMTAFASMGVTFTPEEAALIKRLTDKTTLVECVSLGATLVVINPYAGAFPKHTEYAAVFTKILVNEVDGEEMKITHPVCIFSSWCDGMIINDGTHFGLITAAHVREHIPV
jgi:hypothetical protein